MNAREEGGAAKRPRPSGASSAFEVSARGRDEQDNPGTREMATGAHRQRRAAGPPDPIIPGSVGRWNRAQETEHWGNRSVVPHRVVRRERTIIGGRLAASSEGKVLVEEPRNARCGRHSRPRVLVGLSRTRNRMPRRVITVNQVRVRGIAAGAATLRGREWRLLVEQEGRDPCSCWISPGGRRDSQPRRARLPGRLADQAQAVEQPAGHADLTPPVGGGVPGNPRTLDREADLALKVAQAAVAAQVSTTPG